MKRGCFEFFSQKLYFLQPLWYHNGTMVSLSLKNVPDDLMQDLRQAAVDDRRSLNQEVLYLLRVVIQAKTVKNEVAQYRQAYLKNPENSDELTGLLDIAKQRLVDLPWDET